MSRSEITLQISDKRYVDDLIISLVRQGYSVYLSLDNEVCFTVSDEEAINKLKDS